MEDDEQQELLYDEYDDLTGMNGSVQGCLAAARADLHCI